MDIKDVKVTQEDLDKIREESYAKRIVYLSNEELYAMRRVVDHSLEISQLSPGDKVSIEFWQNLKTKLYNA